jgi:hypothetical protein
MDLKGSARDNASRVGKYLSNAGVSPPAKYADGGKVGGKKPSTTIQINIGGNRGQPGMDPNAMAAMAAASKPPLVNPPPAPAMPPPGGPPMGGPGGPPGAPPMPGMPGMKRGGKAGPVPMEFGAMTGVGREEKILNQAKASGQSQPIKGTAMKAQKAIVGKREK